MKNGIALFFLVLFAIPLFGQNKTIPAKLKPIGSDYSSAIPLSINTANIYGPTDSTNGFGIKQEINNRTPKLFEEEHNTAWYILNMTRGGTFVFEIEPVDSTNDYDFALFNYTDSTFADNLKKNKLPPLRTNLSNLKFSKKGRTGLRPGEKDSLIGKGPGNAYSNAIKVTKGERYVLILDNVTPKGKGHTLFFSFMKDVEIKGKIVGADSLPLVADIILSDNKGNAVKETTSNANGEYKINTAIKENQNYSLTYIADNSFVQTTTINTKDLKGKSVFPDIKTVLPKLKKGEKYKLGNINFYGNVSIVVPESFSSLESLYKLMKKNKKMVIEIQGHVNDPVGSFDDAFDKTLSDARAAAIAEFLEKKGIEKDRVSSVGLSNKFPLYKKPVNEFQEQANRRVEIKVVSIE